MNICCIEFISYQALLSRLKKGFIQTFAHYIGYHPYSWSIAIHFTVAIRNNFVHLEFYEHSSSLYKFNGMSQYQYHIHQKWSSYRAFS